MICEIRLPIEQQTTFASRSETHWHLFPQTKTHGIHANPRRPIPPPPRAQPTCCRWRRHPRLAQSRHNLGVVMIVQRCPSWTLHPGKWTAGTPKFTQLKRKIIFQATICGFQPLYNFPGCLFYNFIGGLHSSTAAFHKHKHTKFLMALRRVRGLGETLNMSRKGVAAGNSQWVNIIHTTSKVLFQVLPFLFVCVCVYHRPFTEVTTTLGEWIYP